MGAMSGSASPEEQASQASSCHPPFFTPTVLSSTEVKTSLEDGGRRKYRKFACDACFKRKIGCDAVSPQCNWCEHHDTPCVFTRRHQLDKRKDNVANGLRQKQQEKPGLGAHIDQMKGVLHETISVDLCKSLSNDPYQQIVSRPAVLDFAKLYPAGINLGSVNTFNGIPFFSSGGRQWIESRSGQIVNFENFCGLCPPVQTRQGRMSDSQISQTRETVELPEMSVLGQHIAVYNASAISRLFPFLEQDLFIDTIRLAYLSHPSSQHGIMSARACIFSFMALMSGFQEPEKISSTIGSRYASEAQRLLVDVLQESANLDGLQALLMLSLFSQTTFGDLQSTDMFMSAAARYIFMLGGHHSLQHMTTSISVAERHLRDLFWICYVMDKKLSLRTGRPPCLSDDQCDLTIPEDYPNRQFTKSGSPQVSYDNDFDFFSFTNLQLSIISSKIYNCLYSAPALRISDMELLKTIRELDSDLEGWRMSVPEKYRPTLSSLHQTPEPAMNPGAAILQLQYYHCIVTIHQVSSRCSAWAEDQNRVMEGVSSSLALTVQASRSSLKYLQVTGHIFKEDSFWFIVFYPISASLTLFCNILLNPQDPRSAADLQILDIAPVRTRQQLSTKFSQSGMLHAKLVEGFIVDLGRLATCAILKAQNEAI